MKTDSIFYRIFQTNPGFLFEILGQPSELAAEYKFRSVEVKQLAFRIDGIFLPDLTASDQTVIFLETQFQKDTEFYHRYFAEIFNYLKQYPLTEDWKAVVLFSRRSVEPTHTHLFRKLLQCEQFQRIYLEDFLNIESELVGVQLMQLILAKPDDAVPLAQALFTRTEHQVQQDPKRELMLDLIETIMVYKFPELSREAIEKMFTTSELKQTRVYREAVEEGALSAGQSMVLRLLERKIGSISPSVEAQISALDLPQLESLCEALLDFSKRSDLTAWLQMYS